MKVLGVLCLFVVGVWSHMCLLNPYQREDKNINMNQIANPACDLDTPPCGGASPDERVTEFISDNSEWIYVINKNLDHYNAMNPGNFTINLLNTNQQFLMTIGSVPDSNAPSGSIYQLYQKVPGNLGNGEPYVVQAIYYTNQGYNFYQCGDVIALG